MKNNFKHIFSPLTINGMTLPNRVVMMPMGSDFAGHTGELSDEHIKYYELRARGGTGLYKNWQGRSAWCFLSAL